jgi:hypothetical protein
MEFGRLVARWVFVCGINVHACFIPGLLVEKRSRRRLVVTSKPSVGKGLLPLSYPQPDIEPRGSTRYIME